MRIKCAIIIDFNWIIDVFGRDWAAFGARIWRTFWAYRSSAVSHSSRRTSVGKIWASLRPSLISSVILPKVATRMARASTRMCPTTAPPGRRRDIGASHGIRTRSAHKRISVLVSISVTFIYNKSFWAKNVLTVHSLLMFNGTIKLRVQLKYLLSPKALTCFPEFCCL